MNGVSLVRKTVVHESWMLICCCCCCRCCYQTNDEELVRISFHTQANQEKRANNSSALDVGCASAGANNQSINGRIFFNFHFRMQSVLFLSMRTCSKRINAKEEKEHSIAANCACEILCVCVYVYVSVSVRDAVCGVRLIHDQNESKCFANS